jgi:ACS family hexuronate transporter-like MFS transporter
MSTPPLQPERGHTWRWWVCCLLLLATMFNYMDRLTLNLLAPHIIDELRLDLDDYASIEAGFALAFAAGAICFGFLVDRWNVFWVYPLAVLGWSAAGFATGQSTSFAYLLLCRVLLGFAESANWPCALRTTQRVLTPAERTMGNSILQSGAALGAILIPLVMFALFDKAEPATWRKPFFVIGAVGAGWVLLWWFSVRPADLALPPAKAAPFWKPSPLFLRRYGVLVVLVVTINMTWHFLRAWGPLFLRESAGFDDDDTFWFFFAYYIFTDVGALSAGFLTLQLVRGGMPVHAGRRLVFFGFALMTTLCVAVPFLPGTWTVVAALLVVGFGALGVFPNYYSFSQDLTVRRQGKVTGALGCCCWSAMAIWQKGIGWLVTATGSYTIPFVISGIAPLFGFFVLLAFWGDPETPTPEMVEEAMPPAESPSPKHPCATAMARSVEVIPPA